MKLFFLNLKKKWAKLFGLFLLVLLLIVSATYLLPQVFNKALIDQYITGNGYLGIGYFLVLFTIATAIGFPRQLAAFLSGYAFDYWLGSVLATCAAGLGCCCSFYFSRYFAHNWVNKKFSKQVSKINNLLAGNTLTKVVIIRLLPVGNNLITNLVAGVTSVKPLLFIGGSTLGYFPQMFIFALAGSGVMLFDGWKLALALSLLLISVLLSSYLVMQHKRQQKILSE